MNFNYIPNVYEFHESTKNMMYKHKHLDMDSRIALCEM